MEIHYLNIVCRKAGWCDSIDNDRLGAESIEMQSVHEDDRHIKQPNTTLQLKAQQPRAHAYSSKINFFHQKHPY